MVLNKNKQHSGKDDILKLIELHRWRKVQIHVLMHKKDMSKDRKALKFACYHHPPLQVIKCLFHANPEAISVKDSKGNYPLHIACKCGSSPSVIKYLLKKYPQAAMKTDIYDRNPFLIACKSYLWHHEYSQQKWEKANRDLLDVLQILSMAIPRSLITNEDCDEMTPQDYTNKTRAMPVVCKYVDFLISIENESNHNHSNTPAI